MEFNGGNFKTQAGKWYNLRFIVSGNHYEAFIDDKQICEFQTNLPESGGAGVFVANCEVHFDNVVITGDEIPGTCRLSPKPNLKQLGANKGLLSARRTVGNTVKPNGVQCTPYKLRR
ncbi:hypothetical protein H8E77_13695 [bacterium]|nr:hypothetical protein [bacterium]